jgi:hypothetical protein
MPVELAKSSFDHHNCADYSITTTILITGLEEAIGKLAKVVQRCKSEKQSTVSLQAKLALQSVAADCDEIRVSLSSLLEGVRPK